MSWSHPVGSNWGIISETHCKSARKPSNHEWGELSNSKCTKWCKKKGPTEKSRWAYSNRSNASLARTPTVSAAATTCAADMDQRSGVNRRTFLSVLIQKPLNRCSCFGVGVFHDPRPKNNLVLTKAWKSCKRVFNRKCLFVSSGLDKCANAALATPIRQLISRSSPWSEVKTVPRCL